MKALFPALLLGLTSLSGAFGADPTSAVLAPVPAYDQLNYEIGNRLQRVHEFEFIRKEAERLGVRAYLFGGTAAGYAHYVKWDLQREKGDTRFQPDRFDYDYTNIYRSTQDADLVVDGAPEKAKELQRRLAEVYPHLKGTKSAWEVRLLRQDMDDKQALLNNPDFLNQHTDSNSTGMIEVTKPPADEPVVRDLRDWESRESYFLKDVRDGKLHYYFSKLHGQTKFAQSGRNPPILSVIRYLTKAFQYELEIRSEDLVKIRMIIDRFNPKGPEMQNDYVRNWLLRKEDGRKILQNAVNLEYAWNTLQTLGLREKLIQVEGNPTTLGSLAWWLSREPLRTRELGTDPVTGRKGGGKTAGDLAREGKLPKDLVVAHETSNFLAYESITRAHTGDPNVLTSRDGAVGETAVYGNGFYTRTGREGARGTGITIRFQLNPDAREGTDFLLAGDYVVVRNKAALRTIPESLSLGPVQYLEILLASELKESDLGIVEKLERRIAHRKNLLTADELREIEKALMEFDSGKPLPPKAVHYYLGLQGVQREIPDALKARLASHLREDIARWEAATASSDPRPFVEAYFGQPDTFARLGLSEIDQKRALQAVLGKLGHERLSLFLIEGFFSRIRAEGFSKELEKMIAFCKETCLTRLIEQVLSKPDAVNTPGVLQAMVDRLKAVGGKRNFSFDVELRKQLVERVFSRVSGPGFEASFKNLIKDCREDCHFGVLEHVLSKPGPLSTPEVAQALINVCNEDCLTRLTEQVLSRSGALNTPEVLNALVARLEFLRGFGLPMPMLRKMLVEKVFSQVHGPGYEDAFRKLITFCSDECHSSAVEHVLARPGPLSTPAIAKVLIAVCSVRCLTTLTVHVFSTPGALTTPDIVQTMVGRLNFIRGIDSKNSYPRLRKLLIEKVFSQVSGPGYETAFKGLIAFCEEECLSVVVEHVLTKPGPLCTPDIALKVIAACNEGCLTGLTEKILAGTSPLSTPELALAVVQRMEKLHQGAPSMKLPMLLAGKVFNQDRMRESPAGHMFFTDYPRLKSAFIQPQSTGLTSSAATAPEVPERALAAAAASRPAAALPPPESQAQRCRGIWKLFPARPL